MTFINRFHGSFNQKKSFRLMETWKGQAHGQEVALFASYRCLIAFFNDRSETTAKCDYNHSVVEKRQERKWLLLVDGATDFS